MVIDVHTHIVPENFPAVGSRKAGNRWPCMDHTEAGKANVMIAGRNFRTVLDRCWSVPRRLREMAEPEYAVDRQVLSPMPELLAYRLEPQDGRDLARHLNEVLMGMVDQEPDRFYALGSVPLQDVDLATEELQAIKSLGLHGIEILSNINGKNLGDVLDERRSDNAIHESNMLRMHEDWNIELFGGLEKITKLSIAQVFAIDITQDLNAMEPQRLDRPQLFRGEGGILKGH